jgi:hypothetical protein
MIRSVIVIGGFSTPLGPFLVDRLLSQNYGIAVLEGFRADISALPAGGGEKRKIVFVEYNPEAPGDLDFHIRNLVRKSGEKSNWVATVDLLDSGSLFPEQRMLYVNVSRKQRRNVSPKQQVYIQIPRILVTPARPRRAFKNAQSSPTEPVAFVGDIVKFITDCVVRNPISNFLGSENSFHLMCSEMLTPAQRKQIPPDCIVELDNMDDGFGSSIDVEALTEPGKKIYGFYPCSVSEAMRACKQAKTSGKPVTYTRFPAVRGL